MRRILFGGLGLALGVFATPAAGQDSHANPPPQRAARLGQPVAVSEQAPGDPEVTPAGLLRRSRATPLAAPIPPAPLGAGRRVPARRVPMSVPVTSGVPMGVPVVGAAPAWQAATGTPSVTQERTGNGQPPAPSAPTVVPSVPAEGGILVPQWGMDAPLYSGAEVGMPAVGRVAGIGRWRVSGEYLMWWTRAADLPALVTTSSVPFNGQIGVGDTQVLVGNDGFGQTFHSGARFSAVRWFGDTECRGIDARLFFLGQAASASTATSAQYPLLARPFINTNPGTPFFGTDSQIIAAPGLSTGGITVDLENSVWGAEMNYRRYLCGPLCGRIDGLVGYRYLNMNEQLQIAENFARTPNSNMGIGAPATAGVIFDHFKTENHFHGGQIGLAGEWRRGRWSLDTRATIAFGNLNRIAEINGAQSLVLANGAMVNTPGGLLALPGANIGRFSDNVFSVVPEVGVNLGYFVTPRLQVFVGYNFLYLTSALRPGNVIDPFIDAARIPNFLNPPGTPVPGLAHPTPNFRSAGFFVQGISFGMRFDW